MFNRSDPPCAHAERGTYQVFPCATSETIHEPVTSRHKATNMRSKTFRLLCSVSPSSLDSVLCKSNKLWACHGTQQLLISTAAAVRHIVAVTIKIIVTVILAGISTIYNAEQYRMMVRIGSVHRRMRLLQALRALVRPSRRHDSPPGCQ